MFALLKLRSAMTMALYEGWLRSGSADFTSYGVPYPLRTILGTSVRSSAIRVRIVRAHKDCF